MTPNATVPDMRMQGCDDVGALGRLHILSPHLDDAVLSCGALLAARPGASITTVLAGDSPRPRQQTPWDIASGFANAEQAMHARREEDKAAAAILHARVHHLPLPDGQYSPVNAAAVAEVLKTAWPGPSAAAPASGGSTDQEGPITFVVPLGLFHSDHQRIAEAWQILGKQLDAERHPAMDGCGPMPEPVTDDPRAASERHSMRHTPSKTHPWLAYEDQPYRQLGDALHVGLVRLHQAGWRAIPARWRTAPEAMHPTDAAADTMALKRRAIDAYASQHRALPHGWIDAVLARGTNEGYWWVYPT